MIRLSARRSYLRSIISSIILAALPIGFASVAQTVSAASDTITVPFHRITVVDSGTGRGIPAAELRTTDARMFITDSAGVVAFMEPDLMNKDVFFHLESFGYDFPPNGFGQRGTSIRATPGGSSTIKMNRINVAQRLYRITGSGIYRDSILLGDKVPATQDEARTPITGVDSVQSAIYNGKMYWFWGDTSITRNPLGNFRTTGATSELPGKGGLDPDQGVSLTFFRTDKGEVRPMFEDKHSPIWVGGPRVLRDKKGKEHLFINYDKVNGHMGSEERGLAEFDDNAGRFQFSVIYPKDAPIVPNGAPLPVTQKGSDYYYYAEPWPIVRSRATIDGIKDLASMEAFTCLKEGKRTIAAPEDLDRDRDGNLRWGWKKNTSPVREGDVGKFRLLGFLKGYEIPTDLRDTNTTMTLVPQSGSVYYNDYRKRWISIRSLTFNPASFLGEVAYFEADTPLGPWVYGQKIVTHRMGGESVDKVTWAKKDARIYTFYNPTQHPEFDKDGGRTIYFEGTYTASFIGVVQITPGYNYNQIMYKLSLDDPRVFMPVGIYRVDGKPATYRNKLAIPKGKKNISIAFFAPDRPRNGTVPVYEVSDGKGKAPRLSLTASSASDTPVFYAEDPASKHSDDSPTVGLLEFSNEKGDRIYTTDAAFAKEGYTKSEKAICRVWPNPIRFDPLAWGESGQ